MTSYAVGSELYTALQAGAVNVTFSVETTTEEVPQYNLIADTKQGDPERTIVVGGHLDSVEEGPGINDNGSGSGTLIEMAEQIAKLPKEPRNRIRFAFWGAEEAGLVGSTAYVADLIESGEIDDIEANLNFDMLASPNFVRFVYDGDNSTGEGDVGPPGSAEIEQVFLRYFASQGLATDADAVRRPLGLRPVHRPGGARAGRRAVLRRRGREDAPSRRRSTAVPPARGTTRATTRRATRSARSWASPPFPDADRASSRSEDARR